MKITNKYIILNIDFVFACLVLFMSPINFIISVYLNYLFAEILSLLSFFLGVYLCWYYSRAFNSFRR
jgi:hypothetical protein